MTGEKFFEVFVRERRKRGRAPLELVAGYKHSHWIFALKKCAKLRKTCDEVILRTLTVTDEVRTRRSRQETEGAV